MTSDDINLHFKYSTGSNTDIRTFSVYWTRAIQSNDELEVTELYQFYHPVTGHTTGVTTFCRQNPATHVFETAGAIEWFSNSNATVHFGIDEVPIRDLRKAKNSQSRRFKAEGSEYKWRFGNNQGDLDCLDSRGRTVASWSQEQLRLRVAARVADALDRIVVTCLLNIWIRRLGMW
ncbi:hypothetical protein L208DRAFT_1397356 [Tricholoma matsutake]|nr:hypothetical protein L208DRAFT_1397356 [Tricholoma matsutake 945]